MYIIVCYSPWQILHNDMDSDPSGSLFLLRHVQICWQEWIVRRNMFYLGQASGQKGILYIFLDLLKRLTADLSSRSVAKSKVVGLRLQCLPSYLSQLTVE